MAEKWLNIVLDLNGILCVCEDAKSNGFSRNIAGAKQPHSATIPALVGPKLVFVRPQCKQFLHELDQIAFVSVWSSMKKSTVQEVCNYLFQDTGKPFLVLGQNSCTTFKWKDKSGHLTTFKEPGTHKDLFLKNLNTLFNTYYGKFSPDNIVVVDDNPIKHIMNKSENVVLPGTWTYKANGPKDTYLMDVLIPWFRRLNLARGEGLKTFRGSSLGKMGRRMLCDEQNHREYNKLMEVVRLSASLG